MNQNQNSPKYDLESRTLTFARNCRQIIKKLPRTISNIEDCSQLTRSSGSIGANYIEANEALSKKDFCMRVKISRKEAKETRYWLNLVDTGNNPELQNEINKLIQEVTELTNIFGAIVRKSE